MRKTVCYLFILIAGFHTQVWCDAQKNAKILRAKKILTQLDGKAEEFLDLLKVPGAAIGVVVEDELVYAKAFGKRNVAEDLPVTTSTLFPIGSATKSFTSFLTGQLVDEGVMDWDEPIVEYLPGFKLANPFTTYEITARDYLTHISGYSRHDVSWYGDVFPRDEMLRKLRHLEPAYGFREHFCYQNLGYMVVGHAAEKLLNKSWEDIIDEYILHPLEMYDTTGDLSAYQASNNHALGYRDTELGLTCTPFIDAYTIGPAGSLNSNIDDMVKWLQMLVKKGDRLIQRKTFDELIKPQVVSNIILNGRYGVEDLVMMETYGLGWFVMTYRGHEAVIHGGNIDGFSSNTCFFPKENIGIVVLTNKNNTPLPYVLGCIAADLALGIAPIDWAERLGHFKDYDAEFYFIDSTAKKAGQIEGTTTTHPLRDFTGVYDNAGYGQIEFKVENDRLEGLFHSMPVKFDHWHYDTFEIAKDTIIPDIVGLKATFRHNYFGEIDEVVIPFEPAVSDIVFKKQKDVRLFQGDYLDRFLGIYNYLGFDFVIKRENSSLVVNALGQPPFILIPEKDGLFTVEGYDGYTIQFFVNEDDAVSAVQLIQPNNTTFTAQKKLSP